MTVEQMMESGDVIVLGEYRGCKTVARTYQSSKTGKVEPLKYVTHIIEVGTGNNVRSMDCEEMLSNDADVSSYKAPANRGERVLVRVEQMKQERGHTTVRIARDRGIEPVGGAKT
jgi:hypothetical protein